MKKLQLNKQTIARLDNMDKIVGGEAGWTSGCTDGCGGTLGGFCTNWNCTKTNCTADCGTGYTCGTQPMCTSMCVGALPNVK